MSPGQDSDPASFDFKSRWQLAVPVDVVWDALNDFHSWPQWWPGLESVEETSHGDADGIGQSAISSWKGPVGYTLGFEIETIEKVYPKTLKGLAKGDLGGVGTWDLSQEADPDNPEKVWTKIVYEWKVIATKKWMKLLIPVARPVFVKSHDHVMKKGAHGLAEYLECEIRGFATGEEE